VSVGVTFDYRANLNVGPYVILQNAEVVA
jgi:hypothetical protein